MPKMLRECDVPGWFREVHLGASPAWSARAYFRERGMAMLEARGFPPDDLVAECRAVLELDGKRYAYGIDEWGHQCAVHWGQVAGHPEGFSTAWWPMVAQSEQSIRPNGTPFFRMTLAQRAAIMKAEGFDPVSPAIEIVERRDRDTPNAEIPAGYFDARTKGGWLYCRGSKQMAFLTGYRIPDPGNEPTRDLAPDLNPFAQIWHTYRMLARDVMAYRAGARTVLLYADDDEVALALAEGRRPKGEVVACKSELAKVLLLYTPVHDRPDGRPLRVVNGVPWVSVLKKRPAVWLSMKLPGWEQGVEA